MSDVKLALEPENKEDKGFQYQREITLTTDSEGNATFYSVPTGKYWLVVREATPSYSSEVTVNSDLKDSDHVELEWPLVENTARNFAGTLHDDKNRPFPRSLVEVLDLRTSKMIESTYTDSTGAYKLHSRVNGLYVVRLSPPGEPDRSQKIVFEFDDGSLNDQLPTMQLRLSDCGDDILVEK